MRTCLLSGRSVNASFSAFKELLKWTSIRGRMRSRYKRTLAAVRAMTGASLELALAPHVLLVCLHLSLLRCACNFCTTARRWHLARALAAEVALVRSTDIPRQNRARPTTHLWMTTSAKNSGKVSTHCLHWNLSVCRAIRRAAIFKGPDIAS